MLELGKGYAIFFLCLFIFTMWGINLLSISQTMQIARLPDPVEPDLVETGSIISKRIKPKPFLYFYLRELGYNISMINHAPVDAAPLLLIIDPPATVQQTVMREIFSWMRNGGNIIFFMTTAHKLDGLLGIQRQQNSHPVPDELYLRLPFLDEIENVSQTTAAVIRSNGMSYFSVFPESHSGSFYFMTARGKGRLVLISHPDLVSGSGLKKQDNLVLLTRTVEYLCRSRQLYIFDPEPEAVIQVRARQMVIKPGSIKTTEKKDDLSFFSLLKANPISWVLAQMLIALSVYFFSLSRRFGSPLPIPETSSSSESHVGSMGKLLASRGDNSFAMSEILSEFAVQAIKRYGLPAKAPFKDIVNAIRQINPATAENLLHNEATIYQILKGMNKSPAALLHATRIIAKARKELKLYD